MSKLVEQVVVKKLIQHISSNNLENPHQSGHSTETALLHIKNEIHLSLSREPNSLVLLYLLFAIDCNTLPNILSHVCRHGLEVAHLLPQPPISSNQN